MISKYFHDASNLQRGFFSKDTVALLSLLCRSSSFLLLLALLDSPYMAGKKIEDYVKIPEELDLGQYTAPSTPTAANNQGEDFCWQVCPVLAVCLLRQKRSFRNSRAARPVLDSSGSTRNEGNYK